MNIENPNLDNSLEKKESVLEAWNRILSRFPSKLQEEFKIERPDADVDQVDVEMFERTHLVSNEPVVIPIADLLEKNKDVIYRTPPDIFEELNQKYYDNKLDEKKCHVHELRPSRLREYSKMPAETADPSTLLDGEICFGNGRYIAALLRGDKTIRLWDLRRNRNKTQGSPV